MARQSKRLYKASGVDLRVLKAAIKLGTTSPPSISFFTGLSENTVTESLERLGLNQPISGDVQAGLIEAAINWVEKFKSFEEVSRALSWDLFEALVFGILEKAGLLVCRNVRVSRAGIRAQIDMVALSGQAVYVLECKRWMRSLTGKLAASESARLRRRAQLLCEALIALIGSGTYTQYVVPLLVSPYASASIQKDAFVAPLRALISLLSAHPSTLPSPPTFKIQLRKELTPDLLGCEKIFAKL